MYDSFQVLNKKGQFISFDLAAAVIVFLLLLGFLYQSWIVNLSQWNQLQQTIETEQKAVLATKLLVEYSGYPKNWSVSDVNIIGLAVVPGVLSQAKIAQLNAMDYNIARQKMNLLAFNFRIEIASLSGPDPLIDKNIGAVQVFTSQLASIERKVLIGEKNAVFRFSLFR